MSRAEGSFYMLAAQERAPLQDHCGILAAFCPTGDIPFFNQTISGLKTLQTRGYDGAGLATLSSNGESFVHKGVGMIDKVFTNEVKRREIGREAKLWVAQTRYGTNGDYSPENVQPFHVNHHSGETFFVAHNGQFSSKQGAPPTELSDTYVFAKELETSEGKDMDERILSTLKNKNGAYSLIIGTKDSLHLIRDPRGIRPLVYGYIEGPNGAPMIVAASETVALERMGVNEFFEVMPGTMVTFSGDKKTITSLLTNKISLAKCIFENVYLKEGVSKADTPRSGEHAINFAPTVFAVRQKSGEILAREAPLTKDQVDFAIGIPGTGIPGGEAYARACGIPYFQAIIDKEKEDQRTFMSADVNLILEKVMKNFNFDQDALRGKRVVLIDDSIVRGNIMTGLVPLLKKQYGVTEVHLRILSPPIDKTCYLGISTRNQSELIAARQADINKIKEELGADSLVYLSGEGLAEAITGDRSMKGYCMGCMQGHKHPINEFGITIN